MAHTYARLKQAIQEGGSVLHNGVLINRIEDLPSEKELVAGNKAAEAVLNANEETKAKKSPPKAKKDEDEEEIVEDED